jgi:hypothetical protein
MIGPGVAAKRGRRPSLLDAATNVFADHGVSAPSLIPEIAAVVTWPLPA